MGLVRCTKCLTPAFRPETAFVDGVCSACIATEQNANIDWGKRKGDLLNLLKSAKPNPDGYNCVVPSSGGKDSHYQVLKLIELGARPLVVTAATCMLTKFGRANINNLARYATAIEVTPNLRVRALLNRVGLELVGDASWAEHISVFHIPWRIAALHKIPLIFYGECPQNAYGGPMDSLEARQMTPRWISQFGGLLGMRPVDLIGQYGLTREDMADYRAPTAEEFASAEAHFLGAYLPWNSHRNAQVAVSAGMQVPSKPPSIANWWTAENLDCFLTGALHDWFGALKFGYGRLCAQISIDIRYGLISRDEAITIVRENDCAFPELYLDLHYTEILRHIGMTEDRFWDLARQYANKATWDVSGQRPQLKRDVWEASFA